MALSHVPAHLLFFSPSSVTRFQYEEWKETNLCIGRIIWRAAGELRATYHFKITATPRESETERERERERENERERTLMK